MRRSWVWQGIVFHTEPGSSFVMPITSWQDCTCQRVFDPLDSLFAIELSALSGSFRVFIRDN